jgi:hypothetical protein
MSAAFEEPMSTLPYDMLDIERSADEARRFDRMENIYHRGQSLAWNGREVLEELVAKHGGTHLPPGKRAAMHAVFGPILWGELAAWKISAQLADRIEPLEAKMAATSQAHDEARHFYVLHDYLRLATGSVPRKIHHAGEKLLGAVLSADDLACKLMGMQTQVETTALTVFQAAREAKLCPVLSDLLLLFEKDEARHVGLGTQYLPVLMRKMNRWEAMKLTLFALDVTFWLIASNQAMSPALRELGIEPRRVLMLAKSKQMLVWEEIWNVTGKEGDTWGDRVSRAMEATANAMWPPAGKEGLRGRVEAFWQALPGGVDQVATSIDPASPKA